MRHTLFSMIVLISIAFIVHCEKDKSPLITNGDKQYITANINEDHSNLVDPRERWEAYQLNKYAITQRRGGFGQYPWDLILYIIDDKIVDVYNIETDSFLPKESINQYDLLTVIDLFELVDRIQSGGASQSDIEFSSRFGYPSSVFVVPDPPVLDGQFSFQSHTLKRIVDIR